MPIQPTTVAEATATSPSAALTASGSSLRPPAEPFPHLKCLSPQERRIVALYALGYTNKEVARELRIGPETVKSHTRRAYAKLGVRTKAGCVAVAYARLAE
jgi:DNA-binding CsgD family transcriptional regulator